MGVGGQRHTPAALPLGMTHYPLYRRLGWPQGQSGQVLKISPPPGFDPRTVQLVASRYTNCAIPALHDAMQYYINHFNFHQNPSEGGGKKKTVNNTRTERE